MKIRICFLVWSLLLIGLLSVSICNTVIAQKPKQSRAARKAAEKAEQARLAKLEYDRVQWAFQSDRWAFETSQLVDDEGMPIDGQTQPNVVGYNGEELEALVVYRYEFKNFNSDRPDVRYDPVHYRGKVVRQEHYTDKKGGLIYEYRVGPPFSGDVTVELGPNTPYGRVILEPKGKSVQYQGKFMPISECWYYMKVEQKRKKK
ncbi:MAG: hypothetical protein ACLTSL_18310 [Odoribacter splanchnicus]